MVAGPSTMKLESLLPLKPVGGDPNTPRTLLTHGSPEWCHRTLEPLRYTLKEVHVSEAEYDKVLNELVEHRAWEKLPDPRHPYGSLDAMLKAELGITEDEGRRTITA